MRNSGALAILLPYRTHRAGTVGAAIDHAVATAPAGNAVVSVAISNGVLTVRFADQSLRRYDVPVGTSEAATTRVYPLATQSLLRTIPVPNTDLTISEMTDISLTMAQDLPAGFERVVDGTEHWVGVPAQPPSAINCVIVDVALSPADDPFYSTALLWNDAWRNGRQVVLSEYSRNNYIFLWFAPLARAVQGLFISAGAGPIPAGLTITWSLGRLGAGTSGAGLTQSQVDARVAAGVFPWAEAGDITAIPASKLTNVPAAGTYVLPVASAATVGGVKAVTDTLIDAATDLGIFGWAISHVQRAVRAIVPAWARMGDMTLIPAAKLTNAPAGAGGGSANFTRTQVVAGTTDASGFLGTDYAAADAQTIRTAHDARSTKFLEFVFTSSNSLVQWTALLIPNWDLPATMQLSITVATGPGSGSKDTPGFVDLRMKRMDLGGGAIIYTSFPSTTITVNKLT